MRQLEVVATGASRSLHNFPYYIRQDFNFILVFRVSGLGEHSSLLDYPLY